jgi:hypothetical protein
LKLIGGLSIDPRVVEVGIFWAVSPTASKK